MKTYMSWGYSCTSPRTLPTFVNYEFGYLCKSTMSDCTSTFALQPGTRYTVGRQPGCDVLVQDQYVSALHCCVWAREEKPRSRENPVKSRDSAARYSDVQGSGDTHVDSNDVAYVVDLSTNGTWLERQDEPSSSSSVAAKRIAKKELVPLRYGDVVHLNSPLLFPTLALRVKTCEEGVCVAATTSDVSAGVIQFVRRSDKEQLDRPRMEGKEVYGDCIPSSKRARHSDDNETTTVPAADKLTTGDSQFECCPTCMQLFAISHLIEHAGACTSNGRGGDAAGMDRREWCTRVPSSVCDAGAHEHGETRGDAVEQCQFCWMVFTLSDLISHVPSCPARGTGDREDSTGAVTSSQDAGGEGVERCIHCFRDFPLSRLVVHAEKCRGDMLRKMGGGRFKAFLPSVHDLDALSLSVLTPTQQAAVEYVVGQSRRASSAVESRLLDRVQRMGYSESDLKRTFHYVRNEAPVIIHLDLSTVLEHLVRDTHYRNLFEDKIFNNIYHDSPPEERVKYGVLNIVGDIEGVKACYGFGDSFLQLKKVRLRTTFASADTSIDHVKLACCEHYANVLYLYNNSELKAILDVATRRRPWADSKVISQYKEVQIHGPVSLSENVDCIVVNSRFRRDSRVKKLLKEFVQKNGCNMIWMDAAGSASDAGSSLEAVAEEVESSDRWWEENAYYYYSYEH